MPIWVRIITGDVKKNEIKLAPDDWNLMSQFEVFEEWLRSNDGKLVSDEGWMVDIGYSPRENGTGGGPVISKEIMQLCLKNNIEIYLSEYAVDA